MKKIILGLLLSTTAFAADMAEEGVVLNQELQFLQESAKAPTLRRVQAAPVQAKTTNTTVTSDLESTYFGEDSEEDTISTQAAGRRRRGTD